MQQHTPVWFSYYTLRLYDTLKSCRYRPFFRLNPLNTVQEPIQCKVFPSKPPHTYTLTPTCIHHAASDIGERMVQRLHQAIYEVASSKSLITKRISFENNAIIIVWSKPEGTNTQNLITVFMQIDKTSSVPIKTHFEHQEGCQSMVQYMNEKQQAQYRHSNSDPTLFVSNPRFARIPIDQWYPHPKAPTYMVYDQLHYTIGDWVDAWHHVMLSSYTKMTKPKTKVSGSTRQRVKDVTKHITSRYLGDLSPYQQLSPETTLNTLRYLFQKHQKGVFIRILNNKLDQFLPFVRQNFTNDYYTKLHLPTNVDAQDKEDLKTLKKYETQLQKWDKIIQMSDPLSVVKLKPQYEKTLGLFLHLEYTCAKRFAHYFKPRKGFENDEVKRNPNRRQWMAHNHFFNTTLYYDNPDIAHFKFLFEQLITHRSVPDIEFFLQLRDYPVVNGNYDSKINKTTLYQPNPDLVSDTSRIQYECDGGLTPVLTHSTKDGYYDIPLPTRDDIDYFAQQYFIDKCNGAYIDNLPEDSLWVEWEKKTISKAVFRGSATGRGTTVDVNQRLKTMHLSHKFPELIDARVVAFNDKYKVENDKAGLQKINRAEIQKQVGAINKSYRMDYDTRKYYKYNLCLDGHIRADRLANEMRTGSLIILPTTDGHRLWYEPFLTPLAWEDIQHTKKYTPATITRKGYTHVTISHLDTLPQLIQWLQANDNICQEIVQNAKSWLFDAKNGHYLRTSPKTSFLFDYMEGVLCSLAKQYIKKRYTLPLVPHVPSLSRSVTSRKATSRTTKHVGIVVGFRDSELNGVRTQQLKQFCEYWELLAPPGFHYTIVIAEQATLPQDKRGFNLWWKKYVEESYSNELSVYDYIHIIEHHYKQQTLPACILRNLALIHYDCWLACRVVKTKPEDIQKAKQTKWSRDECYRRTGEQKFNLGVLKNVGYAHLKATYDSKLSHVVFTDIDMLPDHQLAPYYAQVPQPNEFISLATRGTVYEHFTIDNMPIYTLMNHPMHKMSFPKGRYTNKAHGGKKHTYKQKQKHYRKLTSFKHNRNPKNNTYRYKFSPTRVDGRRCISWVKPKFNRFAGASVSFSNTLFETINGYPNSFWGWGGEDDELLFRFKWVEEKKLYSKVKFTVPPQGRLIDLEIAQPITVEDKLDYRVKDLLKSEKLSNSKHVWETDGLKQLSQVCKIHLCGMYEKFSKTVRLKVEM